MACTFAATPSHSYLRTSSPPDWHGTDYLAGSLAFKTSANANQVLLLLYHDSNNFYRLQLRAAPYNDVYLMVRRAGTDYTVGSVSTYTTDTWRHAYFCADRNTGTIYVQLDDNALKSQASVKFPANAVDYLQISGDNAFVPAFQGEIAEVALWSATTGLLSADVRKSLAKIVPIKVRAEDAIGYWPLIRELNDVVGDADLTAYNSPTVSAHVPLIR